MSNWFCKSLGDAMLAQEAQDKLVQYLTSTFAKAGSPGDMAAFLKHESEGRLHCEVKIYLSPGSAAAALEIGAEPCGRPAEFGLSLLVGGSESWQILFPDCGRRRTSS